jgi:serine/threonine protein kinase
MQTLICPVCNISVEDSATADLDLAETVLCPRCKSVVPRAKSVGVAGKPFMTAATVTMDRAGAAAGSSESDAELPAVPGYQVLEFLASGAMGMVLKARHTALNRVVAIKLPLGESIANEAGRQRFLREARSAASLRHPNICPIYEVGEIPPARGSSEMGGARRGRPYIAMAYVQGETLRNWVKQSAPNVRTIASVMAKLARAVGYAHEHSVIHRDIKPANVIVDAETGEPMLTDFGLAKGLGATEEAAAHVTQSGQVMGTPAYMAPEQAAGRLELIGPHSDTYGLGAVLYDLLTGRPPFLGAVGEILRKVQTDDPIPPRLLSPRLHRDLETICLKALAREPSRRYPSAGELADDLDRFAAGEPIRAKPEGLVRKLGRHLQRNIRAVAVVSIVLAVSGTAVGLFAARASHAARVTTARNQVDSLTSALGGWGIEPEQYGAVESALSSLAALSPADATAASARVATRDADAIESGIRGLINVGPEEQKRMDASIDLLVAHGGSDPQLLARAASLRQLLEARLSTMQPVLEVRPPFANLASAFRTPNVHPDADGLHLRIAKDSPVALCVAATGTDVQAQGIFDIPRDTGGEVSLAANVLEPAAWGKDKDHLGYQFLLHLPPADPSGRPGNGGDKGSVPEPSGKFSSHQHVGRVLMILRDGVPLRRDELPPQQPPDGPIRLTAWREGDRLRVQINDLPPQQFVDVFPLGRRAANASKGSPEPAAGSPASFGSFAVTCMGGARIRELRCFRRGVARAAGPLEHADDLYASGQTTDAMEEYRALSISAAGVETRQAARYKQATCLLELKRTAEATALLEAIAAEPGGQWPPLAGCRLWTLRFQQQQMDEADAVLNSLRSRYTFEQLASILPQETRSAMVERCLTQVSGLNVAGINSARLAQLERVVGLEELLDHDVVKLQSLRYHLVKSYHATGDYARAALEAERELASIPVGDGDPEWAVMTGEQYGWVEILLGNPIRASDALTAVMFDPGTHRINSRAAPLLVERARLRLAMNNVADAQRDLAAYIATSPKPSRISYRYIAGDWLLQGFLLEAKGDADGAARAWRQGIYSRSTMGDDPSRQFDMDLTDLQYAVILGGLSDTLTDADCQWFYNKFLTGNGSDSELGGELGNPVAMARAGLIGFPPDEMREIWRTPRGHEYARRLAMQRLDYAERNAMLPKLLMMELFRRSVAAHAVGSDNGKFAVDQDQVAWATVGDLYSAAFEHKLSKLRLLQLAAAWKGSLGGFGWSGVAPSLAPDVRARLSFLLGLKLKALGRAAESPALFRAALDASAPGSALGRVAEAELAARDPSSPATEPAK